MILWIVLGVVVLVLVPLLVITSLVDPRPSAGPVVAGYAEAIAAGDATAAASVVDPVAGDPLRAADAASLTTDAALAGAVARIEDPRVEDVRSTPRGATASVTLSFTLDGEEARHEFVLGWDESDGRWVLDRALAGGLSLRLPPTGDGSPARFRIAGVELDEIVPGPDVDYLLYPGVYALELDPAQFDDRYDVPPRTEFTILPGEVASVSLGF